MTTFLHWLGAETPDSAWGGIISIFAISLLVNLIHWWHSRCHTWFCFRRAKYTAGPHMGCWKCVGMPKRTRQHHIRAASEGLK